LLEETTDTARGCEGDNWHFKTSRDARAFGVRLRSETDSPLFPLRKETLKTKRIENIGSSMKRVEEGQIGEKLQNAQAQIRATAGQRPHEPFQSKSVEFFERKPFTE